MRCLWRCSREGAHTGILKVDRDGELVGWTDEMVDLREWMVCVRQGLASLRGVR